MTTIARRFNYTRRLRIQKNQVALGFESTDGAVVAVVNHLDLSHRGEHEEAVWESAEVFIEARRVSSESRHRHRLGIVEELDAASFPKRVPLEQFEGEQGIVFRVKVVASDSRLLADGDDIRVGDARYDSEPLISLVPAELGEELWTVDFRDSEGPRVLVNKRLPNYSGFLTRDPVVRGLVMPQIVRAVLPEVARSEQRTDRWVRRWCEFAKRLGCDDAPDDEDGIGEWVEQVVARFSHEQRFASSARGLIERIADE